MKKILVIDGNSIINRAFFGVRPLTTKSGKNTNAIFGMINIISRQLELLAPDYAAVAFDLKAKTFRHEMYPEYKAGRHPTPPELLEQFPEAKEILRLMGISVLELEGFEADDIQGTVASFANTATDTESYILTGDRDLLQLINDKITVLLATNQDTIAMHSEEFIAKYKIPPSLFVEMKALMGDKSDNIPGVRGVGEKTAESLILEFHTLEGIYENINSEKISKSIRAKLIECKEDAFLSRRLAKIDTEAPIKEKLEDLALRPMNREGLYKKLLELELNSIIRKFKLTADDISTAKAPAAHDAKTNQAEAKAPVRDRIQPENYNAEKINGCAKTISVLRENDTVFISADGRAFTYTGEISALSELFTTAEKIICYDGKALLHFLDSHGVAVNPDAVICDIMLYGYVLSPGSGVSSVESLIEMFIQGIHEDKPSVARLEYLESAIRKSIRECGMENVLDNLELPLVPILFEMEKIGFKINKAGMEEFAEALDRLAKELQDRIYFQACEEFNINSPKQLGEVLFVKLGLPYKKKKNKNGFSTDAETLEDLRKYSPIIDDILEYRQVTKLRGTYAVALPKLADDNSRIHTDFKQALTATGRLSSADPNLQNIPIKTALGREMRRYFVADEGCCLVDADYSQIELRLLAHVADDYSMKEAFNTGADIHRKTASAVFGVPEEMVTEEMRKHAKAVNFGIVYGISGFSLAKDIGTTTAEATKYIKSYFMMYPSIDRYLEEVVEQAKEDGYTTTEFGRRRYIPELKAANGMLRAFGKRVAMNAPIQGTAADIMKLAMINVYRALREKAPNAKMVMQVHDELIVECPEEDRDLVKAILREEMESAVKLSVPLTTDVTSGKNWLEQN